MHLVPRALVLAGVGELDLDDLVARTVAVAERISASMP